MAVSEAFRGAGMRYAALFSCIGCRTYMLLKLFRCCRCAPFGGALPVSEGRVWCDQLVIRSRERIVNILKQEDPRLPRGHRPLLDS